MDTKELIQAIKDTIKDYDNNRADCCDCIGCCDCCNWLGKVEDLNRTIRKGSIMALRTVHDKDTT